MERSARVEAGTTTTVDLTLEIGEMLDTVTVRGAVPLIRQDHHGVSGVVTREQIENLPLNGRNFLELAKLEPGVTSPVRGAFNRTFVPSLGAGLQTIPRIGFTRTTVDGASIHPLAHDWQQLSGLAGGRSGIPDVNRQLRSGHEPDDNCGGQHRDAIGRQPASRQRLLASIETTTWRPIRAWAVTRSIPIRSSGGTRSAPPSGGRSGTDRAFFFASYELNDQRGIVSVPAERSRVRLARWTLPESVSWSSVQRACRRAPRSQPPRLRPVHARSQSCVLQRRGRAVSAVCLVPVHGPAQSESRRGHERVVAQRRQRAPVVALSPGRGPGSRRTGRLSCSLVSVWALPASSFPTPGSRLAQRARPQTSVIAIRCRTIWSGRKVVTICASASTGSTRKVTTTTPDAGQVTLWSPAAVRQRDPTIPLPASFASVDECTRAAPAKLPDRRRARLGSPTWLSSRSCPRSLSSLCW